MVQISEQLQPGDKVQQAAPPPPPVMTVIAVGLVGQVECEWYVGGVRNTGWFSASSLHVVP